MKQSNSPDHACKGPHLPCMSLTDEGLMLGRGVLLAKMDKEGLATDEDRILTLLSIAQREEIPQSAIPAIGRAAKHWRSGDKALAAIHLSQIGLRKIDEEDGEHLLMASMLLDAGMNARELAQELGLKIQFHARKYSENQPRVPAGSGRESGQWTSGDAAGPAPSERRSAGATSTLVEGRSAGTNAVEPKHVHGVPKDAIVVTRPDGTTIDDPMSPTKKLMAPPRANFQEVYAAGEKIANWPLMQQLTPAKTAIEQFGTYDFQRDKATNTYFDEYVPAANYAIGVYMAGAGYNLALTYVIAQGYAMGHSSNWYDYSTRGRPWIERGWEDDRAGDWKTK